MPPFVAGNGINDISVRGGFMGVRGLCGDSQVLYLLRRPLRLARGQTINISAPFSPLTCVFLVGHL